MPLSSVPHVLTEYELLSQNSVQKARRYLEKVDISEGVAEAEHVFLLGVLRDGLHNAVLGEQGTAGRAALIQGVLPVGLIEQQGTPCGERGKPWACHLSRGSRGGMRREGMSLKKKKKDKLNVTTVSYKRNPGLQSVPW